MTLPTMRCVLAAAVLAIAGCASTNVSTIPYPNVGDFPPTDPITQAGAAFASSMSAAREAPSALRSSSATGPAVTAR